MDVLLGEPKNSALSTFTANSMNIPYSFTSSALPIVFQERPLYSEACPPSQKQNDFSAERSILRFQNQQYFVAQNDIKPTALMFTVENTKSLECDLDSVPWQYRLGKEASTPPGFASFTSVVTSTIALPSTSAVPLLNTVAANPISVFSPRSSVVPSQYPVAPRLLAKPISPNTGTWLTTATQVTGTGSLVSTTANQETRISLLHLSDFTTAKQEAGTGSSLLTMANQEIGTMSTKTNHKPAKSELYKTELCRAFSEKGSCGYGEKCQFAHGEYDQRTILRHSKYKTKQCWTYHSTGFCYYGARCNFIHDENRLDRSSRLISGQGENSDARFAARLDFTSGINSVPSLGMNMSRNLDLPQVIDWDSRLEANSDPNLKVNSDLVRLSLNPIGERVLNTGVRPKLDLRVAQNLKLGISLNSQPKAGQNVKPNNWQISNVMVPISNGMVRSSPQITTPNMDAGVALSSDQDPRQGIRFNTLKWTFENQRFGHSSVVTDVSPTEHSVVVAQDKDIPFKHSRSEFGGVTTENIVAQGQSHLSHPSHAHAQISSTSVLHPDGFHWNKQEGLLGVSSLSQSCTESWSLSQASMASANNIWSSLIKHPRCWTLS